MPRPSGTPPQPNDARSPGEEPPSWAELDEALAAVQQKLRDFEDRYGQVRRDQRLRGELVAEQRSLEAKSSRPALRAELDRIQQEIDEIDLALESRLFSWDGLKEVFWQAVRFGGLGMVLGWLLRGWSG